MHISKKKMLSIAIIPLIISLIINFKPTGTFISSEDKETAAETSTTLLTSSSNQEFETTIFSTETTDISTKDTDNFNKVTNESTETTTLTTIINLTTANKENKEFPMTHKDSSMSIKIDKIWHKTAYCYVADIKLYNYSSFYTVCANNKYGTKQTTSAAAKQQNAILAVNGDYSAPNINNPLVRKGVVLNDWGTGCNAPGNYNSYTGQLGSPTMLNISNITYTEAVKTHKVTDTFCFGPEYIMSPSGNAISGKCQRTFIGTDGRPGHIIVCVSEGRMSDGISEGLTEQDCVDILLEYGCNFGVPLDGGGSSTMVFKGKVLNSVKQERAVCDFLIFK